MPLNPMNIVTVFFENTRKIFFYDNFSDYRQCFVVFFNSWERERIFFKDLKHSSYAPPKDSLLNSNKT